MQIEFEQEHPDKTRQPFEIIHNARSTKASRSRKSSIHTNDRERPKPKSKKLRKMTMNPERLHFQIVEEIEDIKGEQKIPRSQKGDPQEEPFHYDCLELGLMAKIPSKKEQELENGIFIGIGNERELDSDFNLNGCQMSQELDQEMID